VSEYKEIATNLRSYGGRGSPLGARGAGGKINKMVYDLYGLTEEERKIVEEGV